MASMHSVPPGSSEWAAARGDKWLSHLDGLEPMLAPIDAPLLDALQLEARPVRVADLACGSGATTLAIARRAPKGSVVHGFDISSRLVEKARGRSGAAESGAAFHVADLATTSPPGDRYDRLVTRFGIMFFEDPAAAFANLSRWLAPGGRFAFAVWAPQADNEWLTLARDAVSKVVEVPKPDADAPGPFRYADQGKLLALLSGGGFRDLDVVDWRGKLPIGGARSAEDAADFSLASLSAFAEVLEKAGPAARAEACRLLTAKYAERHHDGAVWLDARVHIVTGR